MSDIVERVARELVRSDPGLKTWHLPGDEPSQWQSPGGALFWTSELPTSQANVKRAQARAAIAAMREPTEEMEQAYLAWVQRGYRTGDTPRIRDAYVAMIDAALHQQDEPTGEE